MVCFLLWFFRDMDIVPIIKFAQLKARFATLALKHKFFLVVALLSLVSTLLPQITHAEILPVQKKTTAGLIFDLQDKSYYELIDQMTKKLILQYNQEALKQKTQRQLALARKVKEYLLSHGSPLADYTTTLVTQNNWKKIVALSNAESSMCEHYPVATSNCWGVGGSNLWDMGSHLGEGVVSMNKFLNNYPLRTKVKYSQMSFDQMNGLYKQPAGDHWVFNNKVIYQELQTLEASVNL